MMYSVLMMISCSFLALMHANLDTSVDDTDYPEEKEVDYEAWTLRELLRIKRDLDEVERQDTIPYHIILYHTIPYYMMSLVLHVIAHALDTLFMVSSIGLFRVNKEREELAKIRGMSEEDRTAYLASQSQPKDDKQQTDYAFLQKYYHKGAFYMASNTLNKRNERMER